jgi:cation transport ATPase
VREVPEFSISPSTPSSSSSDPVTALLSRPIGERQREFRYRFAQAVIFGLPVIALQYFGNSLGGEDSPRWVGLLQGLLTGWVCYVGAAGVLFEGGVVLARMRRLTIDALVAAGVFLIFLWSVLAWITWLVPHAPRHVPMRYHWCVAILVVWSGVRWMMFARRQVGSA